MQEMQYEITRTLAKHFASPPRAAGMKVIAGGNLCWGYSLSMIQWVAVFLALYIKDP